MRALLKQFIAAEEPAKPLSDNQLSDLLKEQGIECARRTVAKYREALRIAPANLRKALVTPRAAARHPPGGLPPAARRSRFRGMCWRWSTRGSPLAPTTSSFGAAYRPTAMNQLKLFLPCAAGVEDMLAAEVQRITGEPLAFKARGGVGVKASWRDAMRLNLHSRLAQRVLVQLWHGGYRSEQDLYNAASEIAWEIWFTPKQTIKVEITAQHSPLTSLNFAALKIKDAICDRFRDKRGERPSVDTTWPDVRIYAHLTTEELTLYIDTSGEPLFKRGWREDKGDAPLKETLAAAMIAATGWNGGELAESLDAITPLYDPCCGSGTVVIEAAQIALRIPPGILRRFAFEKMLPFQRTCGPRSRTRPSAACATGPRATRPSCSAATCRSAWSTFAQRNAERAGVAHAVELRGGDALQRMPPTQTPA